MLTSKSNRFRLIPALLMISLLLNSLNSPEFAAAQSMPAVGILYVPKVQPSSSKRGAATFRCLI